MNSFPHNLISVFLVELCHLKLISLTHLLALLVLLLPCLAGCSVPYAPRGVDLNRWASMDEMERKVYIYELRNKAKKIKEIDRPDTLSGCRAVGMIHSVGETLQEAKTYSLDWAVLLEATHVVWDNSDTSLSIAQGIHDAGGKAFIMGLAYQCQP